MEKVYDKLRGNSNLIVDFAEGAATIKMLRNMANFKKVASDFFTNVVKKRAYKRIKPGPTQGQKRLDYVTGKWLEYRYGWMPLMHSIWDAIDTINRDISARDIPIKARSGYTNNRRNLYVSGSGSYTSPRLTVTTQNASVRSEVSYLFTIPAGHRISDWTSLNPLAIAWELTPLSFVGDWFVNVSEVLTSWENFLLFNQYLRGGYITHTSKVEEVWYAQGQTSVPGPMIADTYYYSFYSTSGVRKITQKSRTVVTTLPISATIRVKFDVNQKRALDACALIKQLFVRH
jgi:hypothetical protein